MISLIYVKDLVKAIINLLSTNAVRESFIVSDGEAYDKEALGTAIKAILEKKTMKIKLPLAPIMLVIRLLESLYKISGKKPFLNREKLREISSANWLCKSDKFWEVLQTKPQYSLATGMKETIEWYKENRWLS